MRLANPITMLLFIHCFGALVILASGCNPADDSTADAPYPDIGAEAAALPESGSPAAALPAGNPPASAPPAGHLQDSALRRVISEQTRSSR